MMTFTQKILSPVLLFITGSVIAAPMPNAIVIKDKGVVPIVKTQIIRKVEGQEPVRTTEATIFEVTNGGKDIIAREVVLEDNEAQFSDNKLAAPVIQRGGVIVPTSKIEVKTTVKQEGQILAETKHIDAQGVEFKKGQEPVRKGLMLNQVKNPTQSKESLTHAVISENGTTTKDIMVLKETDAQ